MLKKNPKFDIKLKYRKIFEIGLTLLLFLAIVAFKTFPNLESEAAEIITTIDIPLTGVPPVPPPPPKPLIPIEALSENDDLSMIEIPETNLDLNANLRELPPSVPDVYLFLSSS